MRVQFLTIFFITYTLCCTGAYAWTKLFLFTRTNPNNYVEVTGSLVGTPYSKLRLTKIIIHGFGNSADTDEINDIKNALLEKENVNVFVIDWSGGSAPPNYIAAANNVKKCGADTAKFLIDNQIDGYKVHCIGHSLGAHSCGFIGKQLKLKRITGLDPAGPLFVNVDPSDRLDKTDADLVDVINTNSVWGISQSIGHKNFYPNGGKIQPGCWFKNSVNNDERDNGVSCSHNRSRKYFIESIRLPCLFKSYRCDNYENFKNGQCKTCSSIYGCTTMGYIANSSKEYGDYFLDTDSKAPFCKG